MLNININICIVFFFFLYYVLFTSTIFFYVNSAIPVLCCTMSIKSSGSDSDLKNHISHCRGNKKPLLLALYLSSDRDDILLPSVEMEEQVPCCALGEADTDWGRTSQVPKLRFLCQPAILAAHPGASRQGKFPKLSTSKVTLITQQ